MAYDKVVDSAQLEAAITATADAIRGKTGDTALIQWLANKGFAEAVATIEAGGGDHVESGQFTLASTSISEPIYSINLTEFTEQYGLPQFLFAIAISSDGNSVSSSASTYRHYFYNLWRLQNETVNGQYTYGYYIAEAGMNSRGTIYMPRVGSASKPTHNFNYEIGRLGVNITQLEHAQTFFWAAVWKG